MGRGLRSALGALSVIATLAFCASASAAGGRAQPLTCTGVVEGGTYSSLTVPPEQDCFLTDATVLGNANVEYASSLSLQDRGLIGGNMVVGDLASMGEDTGWVIDGSTVGNSAGTLSIEGTTHSILANDTGVLALSSATVDGSIVSNKGTYGGPLASSAIHGSVLINATTAGNTGVAATWFIGDDDIDGNLVLTNNQSIEDVFLNTIHQNLICFGNNPPPYNGFLGLGNTVDGHSIGQCATTNSPPPDSDAQSALKAQTAKLFH